MIHVRVLFLGPARDLAGAPHADVKVASGATVADLRRTLGESFVRLAPGLDSMRIAVNRAFASPNHALCNGDEAAVLPPVSGG